MARVGRWSVGGHVLATPNVLFVATSHHAPPAFAEVLLADMPLSDSRPTFVDGGSIFRPRAHPGDLTIPPDSASASALRDLERPHASTGSVVVALSGSEVTARPEAAVVALGDAAAYLRRPK